VNIIIDDRAKLRSVTVGMNIATVLKKQYPTAWETKRYDTLLVHKLTFDGVAAGQSAKELEASWTKDLDAFRIRRTKVLLYPE
jgi:uncharacterized protein YbbC (DUF1343 family)